jgi:hypothetical protein
MTDTSISDVPQDVAIPTADPTAARAELDDPSLGDESGDHSLAGIVATHHHLADEAD